MLNVPLRPAVPPASAASNRRCAESSSIGILACGVRSVVKGYTGTSCLETYRVTPPARSLSRTVGPCGGADRRTMVW
eukprot:5147950-Heterocapsa_arctica.AAC.1